MCSLGRQLAMVMTRAQKAFRYVYTITPSEGRADERDLEHIRNILFPAGVATQNQENDVRIVYNAFVFHAILVTADTDILDRRQQLQSIGVRVMTDEEAVLEVRTRIKTRDDNLREGTWRTGRPLPAWVGRD